MSTIVMSACWSLQMPPTPKAVLISLADNANDHGVCWPSISKICERTCFGRTAVIEAIQWLEQHDYLSADRSNGRRTTYRVVIASSAGCDKPVRQPDRFAKRTGPFGEPNQSAWRTEPVRQADTNHQEPSLEPPQQPAPEKFTLVPPQQLPEQERVVVVKLLDGLDSNTGQSLLDELAGQMAAGKIRTTPSNFMRALVGRAHAGKFTPAYGPSVAAKRTREIYERDTRLQQSQQRSRTGTGVTQARLQEICALLANRGDPGC